DVLAECAAAGVKGAIVLSAGFVEVGERQGVQGRGLRVVGPDCLGIACPHTGLNATVAPGRPRPGSLGLLSQSGALLNALLTHPEGPGCSAYVSVGGLLDVGWPEWLDYLVNDPRTECIGIYAETIPDPRSFFAGARRAAERKPVLLVKGGRGAQP